MRKVRNEPSEGARMAQDIRLIRQILVAVLLAAVIVGIVVLATNAVDTNRAEMQAIVCAQPGAETDPDCQ